MNRHQKRVEAARKRLHANALAKVIGKAKMESLPKDSDAIFPCDMPGCGKDWQFATHATLNGRRRVVARRCIEHRLG